MSAPLNTDHKADSQKAEGHPKSLDSPRGAEQLTPRFIKAEANLLRLPLFALSTKGLRTLDGIECHGTITRNDETHNFVFRASRNTATLYPGPLSRAVHLAFLSLATDRGFPLANPISWGWRDLCRRIDRGSGVELCVFAFGHVALRKSISPQRRGDAEKRYCHG